MADSRELEVILKARDEATRVLQGSIGKMQSMGASLTGLGTTLTAAVTLPIVAVGTLGVKTFADFQSSMNEVFTLLPGISKPAMDKMSRQVKNFADDFGVLPENVIPALYQSLSAGVPPDNVFDFMATAQKAAMGGVTSLETAVDGISSTVNAFKGQALSAGQASDLMFTAVRLGKTTFDELSKSLFNVSPTAAAVGVKFQEVTAGLAAMTAQGIPTNVATTQLRSMLVELSKSGQIAADNFEKLAGKSFREFIASGGDVQGALDILVKGADKAGKGVNELFGGVEAGSAALALTGANAQLFADDLAAMGDSAGATEAAYAQMNQGISRAFDHINTSGKLALLGIGEALAPLVEEVAPKIQGVADRVVLLIDMFKELDPRWQKLILGATGVAAALGPILVVSGKLLTSGAQVAGVVTKIGPLFGMLGSSALPVVGILGGIALAAKLIYDNWDTIGPVLMPLIDQLLDAFKLLGETVLGAFQDLWTQLQPLIPQLISAFTPLLESIVQIAGTVIGLFTQLAPIIGQVVSALVPVIAQIITAVADVATQLAPIITLIGQLFAQIVELVAPIIPQIAETLLPIIEMVGEIFTQVMAVVTPIIQAIVGFIQDHWDDIKRFTDVIFGTIKTVIESVLNVIKGIVNVVMGILTGDWSRAWEGVKQIASGIWNAIKALAEGVFNALKAALQLVWDAIQLAWTALWTAMKALWDTASGWISGIGGKIKGFFAGAINWLRSIGEDIINGLWNGMKAIWDRVSGWVSSVGSKIKNAFKSVLGISSPSKVMHELGAFTMEGLRLGIEGGFADVLRSVRASGQQVSFAMGGALGGVGSTAPAFAPAGGSATTITNHYAVTVDASRLSRPDFASLIESIQAAERMGG